MPFGPEGRRPSMLRKEEATPEGVVGVEGSPPLAETSDKEFSWAVWRCWEGRRVSSDTIPASVERGLGESRDIIGVLSL